MKRKHRDPEITAMLRDYYEGPYGDQIPDELPKYLEDFAADVGGDISGDGRIFILSATVDCPFTKMFECIFALGAESAYGHYEKWGHFKQPEADKFEGLVTVGEWIEFVMALGRILARDNNAASVNDVANTSDRTAVACRIAGFMRATPKQIEEAKSLVGKSLEAVEDHFLKDCLKNRKNS